MKIAIISNFDKEISPNSHGGSEVFTYSLVSELAARPTIDSIDLYGVGKNYFKSGKINFIPILPEETTTYIKNDEVLNNLSADRADFFSQFRTGITNKILKRIINTNCDLIHDNSTSLTFNSLASMIHKPLITTLHTNIDSPSIMIPYSLGLLQAANTKQYFVAVANHQKKFAQDHNISINIADTVYNGIDLKLYDFEENTSSGESGLWIGRISKKHNKGAKEAIIASKNSKTKLKAIMSIDEKVFYDQEIEPYLSSYISIVHSSSITFQEKASYYRNASYLMYPIIWEEPFGLVFIESMASGTPIIAFAKGAVPEIIKDGETGFIVNASDEDIRGNWTVKKTGVEGLVEAIAKIKNMSAEKYKEMRFACRKHVEENFTIKKMVDGYEKVYEKILNLNR